MGCKISKICDLVECAYCGKPFYRRRKKAHGNKVGRGFKVKTCSKRCSNLLQRTNYYLANLNQKI